MKTAHSLICWTLLKLRPLMPASGGIYLFVDKNVIFLVRNNNTSCVELLCIVKTFATYSWNTIVLKNSKTGGILY